MPDASKAALPKSALDKAVSYTLHHWPRLCGSEPVSVCATAAECVMCYVEHPGIAELRRHGRVVQQRAENSMRPGALGARLVQLAA